jgi:hypothetical protein
MAPRFAITTPTTTRTARRWTQRRHARWGYHCASTELRLVAVALAGVGLGRRADALVSLAALDALNVAA